MAREYFYSVDVHGRLWHAGTELADAGFLDAFFRRLRDNDTGRHLDFPFLSPCAGELNFVAAADRPIVYRRLVPDLGGGTGVGPVHLLHAGTLTVPFDPAALRVSAAGRLYHPAPVGGHGLLAAALTLGLAEQLVDSDAASGFALRRGGRTHPLRRLGNDDSGDDDSGNDDSDDDDSDDRDDDDDPAGAAPTCGAADR